MYATVLCNSVSQQGRRKSDGRLTFALLELTIKSLSAAWLLRWTLGGSVRPKRPMRPLGGSVRLKRPMRLLGGSVRLKRLMRLLGGSVRLKRPMRPLGGSMRLKRPMRPLGGSMRLKRPMRPLGGSMRLKRPLGRFRGCSCRFPASVLWSRGLRTVLGRREAGDLTPTALA